MKKISEQLIIKSKTLEGDLVQAAFLTGARQLCQLMQSHSVLNSQEYIILDDLLEAEIKTKILIIQS